MIRTGLIPLTVALLAAAAPPVALGAEAAEIDGELLYRLHCASCHGVDARGGGPMREVLKVEPTNLTRLRKDHDGVFPREHSREIIDGRGEIRGHSSREMPVWGMTFQDPGRAESQEAEVSRRIDALLTYLESIQHDAGK